MKISLAIKENPSKLTIFAAMKRKEAMISILIPAYNYVAFPLAKSLSQQADNLAVPCEIIVADDASTDNYCREANQNIASLPHCAFIGLSENLGRSRIRNFLADQAQGDWMLILDCDGLPTDDFFLERYYQAIQAHADAHIICGGIVHPSQLPSRKVSLRYFYEKNAEKDYTADKRNMRPYDSFRTFNVLIHNKVFKQIRFDEAFRHYGYEDVLFGIQLKEKGFNIVHIDNPLENQDIEPNNIFLKKTEEALRTLAKHVDKLGDAVYLHKYYSRLKRYKLTPLISLTFQVTRPLLLRNLMSDSPSLTLFAFYKLGYYTTL